MSLDNDSRRTSASAWASGDGKSITARNMAAQILYHGGIVIVLDYKLISHMWARGLPNVAYAGTPAEIHDAAGVARRVRIDQPQPGRAGRRRRRGHRPRRRRARGSLSSRRS